MFILIIVWCILLFRRIIEIIRFPVVILELKFSGKCVHLNERPIFLFFFCFFQEYKNDLENFRNSVMPREFNRSFRENPDQNVIREKCGDLNDRYSQLKSTCQQHVTHLADIVDRQGKYENCAKTTDAWLTDARSNLDGLLKEPISAEPQEIQQQIDRLKVGSYFHILKLHLLGYYLEITIMVFLLLVSY